MSLEERSVIIVQGLYLVRKLSIAAIYTLIVVALVAPGVEPLYNYLCKLFKWNEFNDPGKESAKFAVKLLLLSLVIMVATDIRFIEKVILLFY